MITNLLLTGGPTHDFANTSRELASLLREGSCDTPPIATTIVTDPTEFFARLRGSAVTDGEPWNLVTVYALRWRMEAERYASQRNDWAYDLDAADAALLHEHVNAGGGLLSLHTAVICFDADPVWHSLSGAVWDWERSSHLEVANVRIDTAAGGASHPVTAGVEPFEIVDEVYGFLDELPVLEPLLTATHGGRAHPVLWARTLGAGRVVTDTLGHGMASLTHPTHRAILCRAAAWAIGDL